MLGTAYNTEVADAKDEHLVHTLQKNPWLTSVSHFLLLYILSFVKSPSYLNQKNEFIHYLSLKDLGKRKMKLKYELHTLNVTFNFISFHEISIKSRAPFDFIIQKLVYSLCFIQKTWFASLINTWFPGSIQTFFKWKRNEIFPWEK